MCGIAGLIAKNEMGRSWMKYIQPAADSLKSRGPDTQNFYSDELVAFGHCRLTIIDLSEAANQPMTDDSHRYYINYNGEIFNYRDLRKELEAKGISFHTQSDTEVLLQLYIHYGEEMLQRLNGFFAFAIYDRVKKSCFIARDRFGVKPLVFYEDENCLVFASEIKALLRFPISKDMDQVSLYQYLQLNYIPAPHTIFSRIRKLLPGNYLLFQNHKTTVQPFYNILYTEKINPRVNNRQAMQRELFHLLDDAVSMRLISDVPLGAFLSGGIDSSIVCGLAAKHTNHLKTFSIGYQDDFFDETHYARLAAKHFNTDHTVFTLSRSDLHESLGSVLDYLDEPFADSSALPVFLLSQLTRKHVKVSLSGDGADELFGGYMKYTGEYRARHAQLPELFVGSLGPLLQLMPKSRDNAFSNRLRQLHRFAEGLKLNEKERYWKWCCIADEKEARAILQRLNENDLSDFISRKEELIRFIRRGEDLNDVLINDVHLVLANNMLMKVDSMSMANGLEVRTPFLDYRVVEWAFSIPSHYKVDRRRRKKILHDTFKAFLPSELYHRPKRGFEIPLLSLLTHELESTVDTLLSEDFIRSQNIFDFSFVQRLRHQLFSRDPGDSAARMWGLVVFQHWWKKWMY